MLATGERTTPSADKLVIFDDDVCFGTLLSAKARRAGFAPQFFTSLVDLGSFARIKEFDLAIIDYYLGSIRGDEIAEYVDTFFDQVPVIIVSSEDMRERRLQKWPASVRLFIPKADGAHSIIAGARQLLTRERMLRRLAGGGAGTTDHRRP
jgi:DNA-binding response OmpR family regulator